MTKIGLYSDQDKQEVYNEFTGKLRDRFNQSEAESASFTIGNYITDYDFGIITKVDLGKLSFSWANNEEVESCDFILCAPLEIFDQIEKNEIAIADFNIFEDNSIRLGGDMSFCYDLYNIFGFFEL